MNSHRMYISIRFCRGSFFRREHIRFSNVKLQKALKTLNIALCSFFAPTPPKKTPHNEKETRERKYLLFPKREKQNQLFVDKKKEDDEEDDDDDDERKKTKKKKKKKRENNDACWSRRRPRRFGGGLETRGRRRGIPVSEFR